MGRDIEEFLDPGMPAPRATRTPGFVFPHQSFPRGRRSDDAKPGACGAPLVRVYTHNPLPRRRTSIGSRRLSG